jgi:hypothetical protein
MITFKTFLAESALEVNKLKHLEHAEDHIINAGHEGVGHAADTLDDIDNFLKTGAGGSTITTKYDGSPSSVFGVYTENGKFFVGSKSVFNKEPKINYTVQDIENNHGHAPGLVAKLKSALQNLPKIMPKNEKGKPEGVYQGDFMYDKSDLSGDENSSDYSFTPNTITYSVAKSGPEGRKINKSEMGFVVHTKYEGDNLNDMKAGFDVDQDAFQKDPDVNIINPQIDQSKTRYSSSMQKEFERHKEEAAKVYSEMDPATLDSLEKHDITMKTYINSTVRDDTIPSIGGYLQFLEAKKKKDMDKAKSDKGKQKIADSADEVISHANEMKDEFKKLFEMHRHLQRAKDVLVKAMGNPTPYKHTVGGKEVKPEGFVATRDGKPTKLVDRAEFSKNNFGNNRGKGDPDATSPEESDTKNPHVMAFGRMNPPTAGHKVLTDKVLEMAKGRGSGHTVVLSGTQDPEKNPLSGEQKVKHAKRMFPGVNVEAAGKDAPTVIEQAKKLAAKGIDHLIFVAGSDRVDEFKRLLDSYNGKEYNFKRIDVVSAGTRDPDADAEDPSSVSATRQRQHAINNKFSEFKKGIPKDMKDEHAKELFNDVKKGMDIKIDQDTSGISLARYAKRDDVIGVKARKEQQRREIMKEMEKKVKKPKGTPAATKPAAPAQKTAPAQKPMATKKPPKPKRTKI